MKLIASVTFIISGKDVTEEEVIEYIRERQSVKESCLKAFRDKQEI